MHPHPPLARARRVRCRQGRGLRRSTLGPAFTTVTWAVLACTCIARPAAPQEPDRLTFNTVEDRTSSGSLVRFCDEHVAIWMQAQGSPGWKLTWSSDISGSWRTPEPVEDGTHADFEPRLHWQEQPMAVWQRGTSDAAEVMFGKLPWAGDTWEVEPITDNATQDLLPDISQGPDNTVHVAWAGFDPQSGAGKIFHAEKPSGGDWMIERIGDSLLGPFWTGANPRIAADCDGVVHIVYRGGDFGDYHCHYARRDAGSWTTEILFSPNGNDFSVDVATEPFCGNTYVAMSGNDGFGFPYKIYLVQSTDGGLNFGQPVLASGSFSAALDNIDLGASTPLLISGSEVSGNIYTGNLIISDGSGPELLPPVNNASERPCAAQTRCVTLFPTASSVLFTNYGSGGSDSSEVFVIATPVPGGIVEQPIDPPPFGELRIEAAPNPFAVATRVAVRGLPPGAAGRVSASIYDVQGRLVRRLSATGTDASDPSVEYVWDASGAGGAPVPNGNYYLRVDGGRYAATERLTLVR